MQNSQQTVETDPDVIPNKFGKTPIDTAKGKQPARESDYDRLLLCTFANTLYIGDGEKERVTCVISSSGITENFTGIALVALVSMWRQ